MFLNSFHFFINTYNILYNSMITPTHVIIDLYDCIPHLLCNKLVITEFVNVSIKMINMNVVGEPICEQFPGETDLDKGITYAQTLAESLISVHTYPREKSIYIDIFSCKPFETETLFIYAKVFFRGAGYCQSINRMIYPKNDASK